jgi:hypothetical protein
MPTAAVAVPPRPYKDDYTTIRHPARPPPRHSYARRRGPARPHECVATTNRATVTSPRRLPSLHPHRNFPVLPPHCRKAPTALVVQDRHPVPLRSHRAAGDCRSGGSCAARPRTCCRRPRAAGSPGVRSSTLLRQVQLPVEAWGGSSPHRPALKTAEAPTDRH